MKKTLLIFGMMVLATIVVAQREVVLYHGYTGIVAERKLVNANGIKCGYDKIYNTNGVLVEMYTYKNGKKNGPCASYSEYTGTVRSRGNFTADERSGVWIFYNTDDGVPKDTPEERLTYPIRNPNLPEKTFVEVEDFYHPTRVLIKHEKWSFTQGKNVLIYLRTRDSEKTWSSQGKLLTEKLESDGKIVFEHEYWDNGIIKVKKVPNDTCFAYDMQGNKIEAYFLGTDVYGNMTKTPVKFIPAQTKPLILDLKSSARFNCGSSITINHKAGAVAPVTKTVTYGTVTYIPGEISKCWITSNLGADHQATAVNDATEASAGWYWQFNRKQGYKHDGTTRTPNTPWIMDSSGNLEWQTSNDPCALELGSGWRIPTLTEWTNVIKGGGWRDWNGPWNSDLKLHAAGRLEDDSGSLDNKRRGSHGQYWSMTVNGFSGWSLIFYNGFSQIDYSGRGGSQIYGYTLRCLRDN